MTAPIRVQCMHCRVGADVHVEQLNMVVSPTRSWYSYHCTSCDKWTGADLTDDAVKKLILAGVVKHSVRISRELVEPHYSGLEPMVFEDALIDMMMEFACGKSETSSS